MRQLAIETWARRERTDATSAMWRASQLESVDVSPHLLGLDALLHHLLDEELRLMDTLSA